MRLLMLTYSLMMIANVSLSQSNSNSVQNPNLKQKQQEYQGWMNNSGLNSYMKVKLIEKDRDKYVLYLSEQTTSLGIPWQELQKYYYTQCGSPLHSIMIQKFSFQMEVPLDLVDIYILNEKDLKVIKIFAEKIGNHLVDTYIILQPESLGAGVNTFNFKELNVSYNRHSPPQNRQKNN